MALEIIDSETLAELRAMVSTTCQIAKDELLKNRQLLLTAEEVGKLTSYDEKTIRRKKSEIGYRIGSSSKDLRFPLEYVLAWKDRGCVPPKPLPTHRK